MNNLSASLIPQSECESILESHMQNCQIIDIIDYLERLQECFETNKRQFDSGIIATAIQLIQREFHAQQVGINKYSATG